MSYEAVKALLNRGGVARPTLYRVIVPTFKVGNSEVNDQLEFLCSATAVPEVSVNTVTALGQDAQGVVRESPSNVIFGKPFTMTVISDTDYIVYKGLRNWFDTITSNANPIGGGGLAAQKANYYDAVTAPITIVKEENRLKIPFSVTLNNAYPVNIGSIELSSESVDTRLEFTVSFYYETLTFNG